MNEKIDLEKEIESTIHNLKKTREDIAHLREMELQMISILKAYRVIANELDINVSGIDILFTGKSMKNTFREVIFAVILKFDGNEFKNIDVYNYLLNDGYDMKGLHPRNRISVILREFVDDNKIMLISGGKGQSPCVYSLTTSQ